MLLWAGSGDPKKVLGTDFQNKKKLIFLYAFFLKKNFWGDAPVVREHEYKSLGTIFRP